MPYYDCENKKSHFLLSFCITRSIGFDPNPQRPVNSRQSEVAELRFIVATTHFSCSNFILIVRSMPVPNINSIDTLVSVEVNF